MSLVSWLFSGPRIRGMLLKRIAELEHALPEMEREKQKLFTGMFMQDYEYVRGRIDTINVEIFYLKQVLKIES